MVQLHSIAVKSRVSRAQVADDRSGDVTAMLSLEGLVPEAGSDKRPPIDLVIVLDKSGSMRGEKLQHCKETLAFLITSALSESDRLALVLFDSNATVEFNLTNLTSEGKAKCLAAVQRIQSGSNTNLSGGMFAGLQLLLDQKEWAERCGVCLLTDGQMNEGVTEPTKLLGMLGSTLERFQKASTPRSPPSVMTFGFGQDATVDILTSIASKSGGNYYSILSTEAVPLAFSDALGGLLAVVAQNVSVKVTLEGASSITPLTKFDFLTPSPQVVMLNLKDMYAGEHRDILFKVGFTGSKEKIPIKVKFEVTYMDVINEEIGAKTECEAVVARVPSSTIPADVKDDVEIARHQLRWAGLEAMEEARKAADAGDLSSGGHRLARALSSMQTKMKEVGISEADDDMMAEMSTDIRTAQMGMSSASAWGQSRGKHAAAEYSHSHQRSNKTEELLEVKSSGFMMAAAAAAPPAPQKAASTYSVPSKMKLAAATREAFKLT